MKLQLLKKFLILFSIGVLMCFIISCSQSISPVQSNDSADDIEILDEPLNSDGSNIKEDDDEDFGGDKYFDHKIDEVEGTAS